MTSKDSHQSSSAVEEQTSAKDLPGIVKDHNEIYDRLKKDVIDPNFVEQTKQFETDLENSGYILSKVLPDVYNSVISHTSVWCDRTTQPLIISLVQLFVYFSGNNLHSVQSTSGNRQINQKLMALVPPQLHYLFAFVLWGILTTFRVIKVPKTIAPTLRAYLKDEYEKIRQSADILTNPNQLRTKEMSEIITISLGSMKEPSVKSETFNIIDYPDVGILNMFSEPVIRLIIYYCFWMSGVRLTKIPEITINHLCEESSPKRKDEPKMWTQMLITMKESVQVLSTQHVGITWVLPPARSTIKNKPVNTSTTSSTVNCWKTPLHFDPKEPSNVNNQCSSTQMTSLPITSGTVLEPSVSSQSSHVSHFHDPIEEMMFADLKEVLVKCLRDVVA
jgi:hypothetical protein